MTKSEAEKAVRYLCTEWRKEAGYSETLPQNVPFQAFYNWMKENHSGYLRFRAVIGVYESVEHWFNDELRVPHLYR